MQNPGLDYTLTGATVQFLAGAIPQSGDALTAWYRLAPAAGALIGAQTSPGPQITCSATGTGTSSTNFSSLGSCTIPGNVLQSGDRVEIHFDLGHQGTTVGFEFEVLWGGTSVEDRISPALEAMVAGKAEAAVWSGGAQLRAETWGSTLTYAAGVANATDSIVASLTINFQVKMLQATSETVTLRNFTVVRYPAQ